MRKHGPWWTWLFLSLGVVVVDHLSKTWVDALFLDRPEPRVLTSWFNIVLAHNRGAAFSVLAEGSLLPRILFSAVAILASVYIVLMLKRQERGRTVNLGLALILGGALGNLWDRVTIGAVIDFIQWHWHEAYWPAFNIADSAITVGALILVTQSLKGQNNPS